MPIAQILSLSLSLSLSHTHTHTHTHTHVQQLTLGAIQEKEWNPFLHLGVIGIEKREPSIYRLTHQVGRVFANGLGDRDSIPGRVIPKTQKMILDISWLYTQYYKVRIQGKLEQVVPSPILKCCSS